MKLPTVVQIAKGTAHFQWYSDGVLRYEVIWNDSGDVVHSMLIRFSPKERISG